MHCIEQRLPFDDFRYVARLPNGKEFLVQSSGKLFSTAVEVSSATGVRIRISDQGPGIPEQELEQVFGKFYQTRSSRNQSGSTGLGLAICREIIELHRGRIWAERNSQQGTSILFEIPAQPPRLQ